MKLYHARYTLRNGTCGALTLLAASSCAAVVMVLDTFGESLRTCAVRPT